MDRGRSGLRDLLRPGGISARQRRTRRRDFSIEREIWNRGLDHGRGKILSARPGPKRRQTLKERHVQSDSYHGLTILQILHCRSEPKAAIKAVMPACISPEK